MLESSLKKEKDEIMEMLEELENKIFDLALSNDDTTVEQWYAISRAKATINHLEKYPLK